MSTTKVSPGGAPPVGKSFSDLFILILFHIYTSIAKVLRVVLYYCAMPTVKKIVERKLKSVGVEVNGEGEGGMKITNEEAYLKIFLEGDLGAIEAVMRGYMEYDGVKTFEKIFRHRKFQSVAHPLYNILKKAQLHLPMRSWGSGEQPGVDLFKVMLEENMQYSCGYWRNAGTLKESQAAKLDLIARKLHLKPGMRVLDVNCQFGGLAKYLAKNHGVTVVGYTAAKQHKIFGDKLCKDLPVDIRVGTCFDLGDKEEFDRIVSIGTLESFTVKQYGLVMDKLRSVLSDDGILLLQEMGISHRSSPSLLWCQRYAYIPHHEDLIRALDNFIIEDWHNFGYDCYKTFDMWEKNLEKAWAKLVFRYGDEFRRMWLLYLHAFQALWKTRAAQVWQIVLTKDGLDEGYQSYR